VVTEKQIAALAAGRAKRDKVNQYKREHPEEARSDEDRWAMLLDGTITVKDLDDKELKRMQVRNRAGGFQGTRQRIWPSHLRRAADRERLRRLDKRVKGLGPLAYRRMKELLDDPDMKPEVQVRLISMALERALGKVPETVRLETDVAPAWDSDADGIYGVGVDRVSLEQELQDMADGS
jgi:hypothetical protein